MRFKELAAIIDGIKPKHQSKIIAIDGGGGAGKTTFAKELQKVVIGSYIVKIDDFYRPPQLREPVVSVEEINPNFDWDRLSANVFDALVQNKDIEYQLYDFDKGALSKKTIQIPRSSIILVEGVWSMQPPFLPFYDYCFWLEAPAKMRLERGVARDGEEYRHVWVDEWIPIDEAYKKSQKPHLKAHCVIDSASSHFENDDIVIIE